MEFTKKIFPSSKKKIKVVKSCIGIYQKNKNKRYDGFAENKCNNSYYKRDEVDCANHYEDSCNGKVGFAKGKYYKCKWTEEQTNDDDDDDEGSCKVDTTDEVKEIYGKCRMGRKFSSSTGAMDTKICEKDLNKDFIENINDQ